VSASIGLTLYPQDDAVDPDQLLRQADQAMYEAKLLGKNRVHLFDTEHDRTLRGRHESLAAIRRALESDELRLLYQPKVNMASGEVVGVEALVRWAHPERGLLEPAVFLPVVEEHALAIELGDWVIEAALAQLTRWQAQGFELPVSVNISARHLQAPDFMLRLHAALARHPGVGADKLEFEVLETSALESITQVSRIVEACAAIGVRFALDDFGTGFSSLGYLKRLPATRLKIDQVFVRGMLDRPRGSGDPEGHSRSCARVSPRGDRRGRGVRGAWPAVAGARLRDGAGLLHRAADAGRGRAGLGGELVAARSLAAYATVTGILPIFACHSFGPVLCTLVPLASTATVTGMSCTVNS